MKKTLSKALSLVLALAMCLTMAVPAFAAKPEFEIDGTTLNKYNGPGGDVTVPSGVTTLSANAFRNNKNVTSVTLPDTVTSINHSGFSGAFQSATSLKNVYLSNNLTSIGNYAFSGCSSLESVALPDSVTSIGTQAFCKCSSMKTLTLSNNLISMGDWAFYQCTSLLSIDVPGSLANIPERAFYGCSSVKSITVREGVRTIDVSAFRGCSSATRVTLPASVTTINMYAFHEIDGLRDVYYSGSEEQWNAIKIDVSGNKTLKEATIHYNSPMPEPDPGSTDVPTPTPTPKTAYANTQTVLLDGKSVEFQTYALKNANGGLTNYIKLQDLAYYLNGTNAQFSVDWNAAQGILLTTGRPYAPVGTELSTPFSGDRPYQDGNPTTTINNASRTVSSIVLTDDKGGDYTYYQLRDMGRNLGFNVSYINGQVVINTNEPYSDAQ